MICERIQRKLEDGCMIRIQGSILDADASKVKGAVGPKPCLQHLVVECSLEGIDNTSSAGLRLSTRSTIEHGGSLPDTPACGSPQTERMRQVTTDLGEDDHFQDTMYTEILCVRKDQAALARDPDGEICCLKFEAGSEGPPW